MKIIQIKVKAGRVFNHPHESYSNLQPSIELVAMIDPEEDWISAGKRLQDQAERMVESHKQAMLQTIEQLAETAQINNQIDIIKGQLERAQESLAEFEKRRAELKQPNLLPAGE